MLTFFHPDQLLHHPRSYLSRGQMRSPQEVPERAMRLVAAAHALGFEVREPADAGTAPLAAVHDTNYLRFLEEAHREWKKIPADWGDEVMSNVYVREPNPLRGVLAQAARYLADGSCPVGAQTWRSAYWSAQSAVAAAAAVNDGVRETWALCRPPGHHARTDAAGGFCYLNNAAIAAQSLRSRYARVAILDTDMHHGQGVQEIFYGRDDVLYVSVHGDPTNFYPVVAGFEDEHGEGTGAGFNVNLPMPHGSSEATFFAHVDAALQALKHFEPDALVLALGFDIYREDPQSQVAVTTEGFGQLGEAIGGLGLPSVIVQEGGYHLESLEANARAFFGGFAGARGD
ncbi:MULTISPECIES: histone deacetylase family protein [Paraburkholderia]|uniref:histone deacetylase family protein n=1 Tax=Paraburkholderia TaxID=1822464 RepID=UPI002256A6B0|nr:MULTISPECIES: histone deacetylase family protein [Paraburkholderia]MCX4165388.1 histone deacetylase family protein [Paraburkholderia megapolitana]MDN7160880.1 histone deacetylase family protein [Paraburkholderia sp. CHISQ3]MDQ6497927.1 histone deacetylase family protein [Paraburkholderia megapolitana]